MKTFDTDERIRRIASNRSAADMVRNFLESRRNMDLSVSGMVRPDVKVALPESRIEPVNPDLAPELYNMVPLMYDIPVVTNTYPPRGVETSSSVDLFSDEAKARRRIKQAYTESRFDRNANSGAGARGLFQIMPITEQDYLGGGRGKKGDIWNADYNGGIRDWVMSVIPRDLGKYWSEDDSDINKLAKLYAAYNWGAGNLRNFLQSRLDAGLSNDDPYEWVEAIVNKGKRKDETRNYVKFLALNQDIPDSYMTNEKFEDTARARGYMAKGGKIHIDPKNRGKFNALLKRTGKSASWFKGHGTPLQRKRATFALNARKWRHGDGGFLENYYDGETGPTVQMDRWNAPLYSGLTGIRLTDNAANRGVDYVTDVGPLVGLDDGSIYLGGIEPSVVVAERPNKTIKNDGHRQTLLSDIDTASSPVQTDSFLSGPERIMLSGVPVEMDRSLGEVVIPARDTASYFRAQVQKMEDENNRFDARKLSNAEIRSLQQEMADAGFYSSQLSGKSKDEIIGIQKKLISRGLLSDAKNDDGTYKEADGIVGKRTKEAWNRYNVDGRWGARSETAYKNKQNVEVVQSHNWNNEFSAKGIDGCAAWVTKKYESVMGGNSQQMGVTLNAWQMPKNIVAHGGTMLYNLFDSGFNGVKTEDQLKARTLQRLREEPIDYSMLRPGDVVGLFYSGSHYFKKVLEDGTTYNTHIGIVTGYDSDGVPIVEHNIGQKVHSDRADRIQITVAVRPNHSGVPVGKFKLGESKYEVSLPEKFEKLSSEEKKENLKTYMDSMAGASEQVGRIYNNADMDAVQRIAVGVLERETGYMQNTESSRTGRAGMRVKAERLIRDIVQPVSDDRKSTDLTKFKMSTLSPDERVWLGINKPEDLNDPAKAGRAVMLMLAKNYDYFVRYAKENPQLGLTKQDIEDLTALSYNQGMTGLYSVGTAIDDKTGKRYVASGKLQAIREAAESDEQIGDFSATKLGRIAKEMPALAGLMKELYHQGIGGRSTSYMNSARKAIQNVREKQSKQQ